jgi:hypothetical protein
VAAVVVAFLSVSFGVVQVVTEDETTKKEKNADYHAASTFNHKPH